MNFALIGAGGYIAPRHLTAIRDVGATLISALDPNDSVGILDKFSFDTRFFTEFERFDRHAEKLRRRDEAERVHWVSICSPNYLHDAHIRFALRIGASAICEKPVVIEPWNLDALEELEAESGAVVRTVLQLRVHQQMVALRDQLIAEGGTRAREIDLTYITSRGRWYATSWKGQLDRSGGLATNIGIHFFDLLIWLFGAVQHLEVHVSTPNQVSGWLELERARVRWFLSIDRSDLPQEALSSGKTTYRSIKVDGTEIEFSDGFADLHTAVYRESLAGRGFSLADARPSVQLAHDIRKATPELVAGHRHPHLQR